MFAVEWSEWVVRLPGSGGSPVWTVVLLLGLGALLLALANFLDKIASHARNWIGPAVSFLVLILSIYALNYFFGEGAQTGPDRNVVIGEDDCESLLLDRCPTQDTVGGGGG